MWGAVGVSQGDLSSSDSPSLPLCYLVVCLGILMVDRPSANKLRRSISSSPDFPAQHPALFHVYTFSRAGSFVQARVPWTRTAPLLFACCQVTPFRSWKQPFVRTPHSHMALGPPSIMHSTTTHHPTPAVTAAHDLFPMGCAATQLTVVARWYAVAYTLTISCRPALQTTFTPPHMNILN